MKTRDLAAVVAAILNFRSSLKVTIKPQLCRLYKQKLYGL